MDAKVYLDYNATAPLLPEVLEKMLPWMGQGSANPSSEHSAGRAAREAIEAARAQVAESVGATGARIVFAASGTEANNLFLQGVAATRSSGRLAISALEHPCVREPARALRGRGWDLDEIWVDTQGRVAQTDFEQVLAKKPDIISMMAAHNEIGVLQDIAHWAALAQLVGAVFHTDAVQLLGKAPLNFAALGVHAMTLSAHKIGGPQGMGALVLRPELEILPLEYGGQQEYGLRPGTENVAAIVGFGHACVLAKAHQVQEAARLIALREHLEAGLKALGAVVFAEDAPRIANTVFFALPGYGAQPLVQALDEAGFQVSSGAACNGASPQPSRALIAMGVPPALAQGAIRISMGANTSAAHIEVFLKIFSAQIQGVSPSFLAPSENGRTTNLEVSHA